MIRVKQHKCHFILMPLKTFGLCALNALKVYCDGIHTIAKKFDSVVLNIYPLSKTLSSMSLDLAACQTRRLGREMIFLKKFLIKNTLVMPWLFYFFDRSFSLLSKTELCSFIIGLPGPCCF